MKNNLQKMRKELGLTQSQLAEMVGISARTIQNYEKGRTDIRKIDIITAQKIAQALGYGMDEFVEALGVFDQNKVF